ncbi:MAG TPA: c-type cytochrome [Candidatus Desulfobacillus sp.]|nr:c-type cytochrome [Candidatus Desulfobacillus sp.]
MNRAAWVVFAALACAGMAMAAEQQPREQGIESSDYVWNEMYADKLQALQAKGDPLRGEIAFEICQGCHRKSALGRVDGSYPRLAGQHATVLIKQMTDVRAGRRDNPRMFPFASQHAISPQDIADIAAYLQGLPVPDDNGKGPGTDLAQGGKLYNRDCSSCHGDKGEGNGAKFYPRVSGQHFKYLAREAQEIRNGNRRNADPRMMRVIKNYSDADLQAVTDYMSRLPVSTK